MTATLLASMFTVIAASSAMAAVAVTSAGTVPRGSTSTGTTTFTFTENTAGAFADAGGTLIVTIDDAGAGAPEPGVTFSGTPVLVAPGSLGATVSVAGNVLTITTTAEDSTNIEQITVSGLAIKADIAAGLGAISATLTGTMAAAVTPANVTATGVLQEPVLAGATVGVSVNVTSTCNFVTSGNTANFSDVSDARTITVAAGPTVTGVQDIDFGAGTTSHPIGTTVTQTVPNCNAATLPSPGTVADVVVQDVPAGAGSVQPGEFNQAVSDTTITEQTAGYIADNTVLTFTLSSGLFSNSPIARVTGGAGLTLAGGASAPCNLSFDRKSCTVQVTDPSTAAATITLGNAGGAAPILVDIPAGTAIGTAVNVVVTASPAINVSITANTVAYVARVVVGTAATPTIYINENDQPSGQISIVESGAGFFTGGTGSNNAFALCLTTGESFTRPPFAVVVSGDLKLLSGVVGATSVAGTLYTAGGLSCARWTVFTASTAASTIEIRGSDAAGAVLPSGANNGPRLSVPGTLAPGNTISNILIGTQAQILTGTGLSSRVTNAVRAFRNQPVVVGVSQPIVPKGATNSLAGCITITETQAGQFKAGETITVTILPRGSVGVPFQSRQDVFLKTGTTADLPIITTNTASGLIAAGVGTAIGNTAFSFVISQQASGTLGVITICNIHLTSLADALDGQILARVQAGAPGVAIDQVVAIGRIGNPIAGTAASRLGVTQTGAFTISTKVQTTGKYVTYRFDFGVGAAGQIVQIWGATKTGNDWSAFSVVTSRIANASGVVYYHIRQTSATWKSYRAFWTGGGAWTPARQARWVN